MRTELIVNMSMNGEVVLASQAGTYEAPQEISGMVFARAMQSGNIILGRTSYEMFAPMIIQMFPTLQVVVLTSKNLENVETATTAKDAIEILETKGFDTVTVAGGVQTYNAFITENAVDDIYMNLFPVMIHQGGTMEPLKDLTIGYELKECNTKDNIVSLHYTK